MASIHVGPDGKPIVMRGAETILAASLREGIPHAYACGGGADVRFCRISVEDGLEFCSLRSRRADTHLFVFADPEFGTDSHYTLRMVAWRTSR